MAGEITEVSPELTLLINNKHSGITYREHRHEPWREIYELYRDNVTVNRLTQRQSVNMPLMKTNIKTLLKSVDDMPLMLFQSLSNDEEKQIFLNEYWKLTLEKNNAEVQDIVDKKQEFLRGRTFDSMQIIDGKIVWNIEDTEDMLVSRFMNPYDIDSSRFLIHMHIFKPLSSLANNPDYDQVEVKKLIEYFRSDLGLVKAQDNDNSLQKKNEKMSNIGITDIDDPVLGETYVELEKHLVFQDDYKDGKGNKLPSQIISYVTAEDMVILQEKPQEEIIGPTKDNFWRDHYNYTTWASDVDKNDFWTDSVGDIILNPNKVVNAFYSQKVENRTLRNFGMTFYDSALKDEGFVPNTWEPRAWGFYGVPGKPSEVLQRVEIPDLPSTFQEIDYISGVIKSGTGATDTLQGNLAKGDPTLGEIDKAETEAKERVGSIAKFYTPAWERRGLLFLKLIEAAPEKIDAAKISTKGRNTDQLFTREISPKTWHDELGYGIKIWSKDEKASSDGKALEKLNAVKIAMPFNPKVAEIYNRRLLEFAELPPDEVKEVMDYERQKLTLPNPMGNNVVTEQLNASQPQPATPLPIPQV